MARDVRYYGEHTHLLVDYPWGRFAGGRVMCSDGKVRSLKRISECADTFFSVPAAVNVGKVTVSGYVTVECASGSSVETEGDPAVAKFIAHTYRKNHGALPAGAWKNNPAADNGSFSHPKFADESEAVMGRG